MGTIQHQPALISGVFKNEDLYLPYGAIATGPVTMQDCYVLLGAGFSIKANQNCYFKDNRIRFKEASN